MKYPSILIELSEAHSGGVRVGKPLSIIQFIETIFFQMTTYYFDFVHAKIFFFGQYCTMMSKERTSHLMFVCEKTHSASRISFVQCGK